jgi:hypothetical protein
MRLRVTLSLLTFAACGIAGCTIRTYPQPYGQQAYDAPLVDGPGVAPIDAPPPPDQCVYVYDPGYPPGTYYYGGNYYYGGYRYQQDVFVTRVVNVNVHENRYVNVADNRRASLQTQARQPAPYARPGGVRRADAPSPATPTMGNPSRGPTAGVAQPLSRAPMGPASQVRPAKVPPRAPPNHD